LDQIATEAQDPDTLFVACIDCDMLYRKPLLKPGERVRCERCGAVVCERKRHGLDHSLALAMTSLILFVLANAYPLLRLNIAGRIQSGAILTGVRELYAQGFWEVSALVFIVTILAPLFRIAAVLYVLGPLSLNRPAPHSTAVFRMLELMHPWAMTEVFMLGILVAIVELADLATIQPGLALYSFAALIVTMAATDASLDEQAVWEGLEKQR
jgi:paraquat-inducible protein A